MPMTSTASEILGRVENDAVFRGFLEAGFDPAAFASKIVRADVGKAHANAANAGAGAGAAAAAVAGGGGAVGAPVLHLQQGGHGVGGGSSSAGGGGGGSGGAGVVASAESVSSQAEITLDVRADCVLLLFVCWYCFHLTCCYLFWLMQDARNDVVFVSSLLIMRVSN